MESRVSDELGPFQEMWEAWNDAREAIVLKPISHFRRAVELQFDELEEHRNAGNRDAAIREATDIVSIALNLMRRLGCEPTEIAEVAKARAEKRMKGQALAILEKYERLYGI
jgi:hypothetical protein